ncbi:hypothetical protein SELMODRAFT_420143 [Selaginella moellendorffii]|uniref:Uncharacterized protein n=1 Tax=Selaginella moellendorffii TaxID=88036 RepID=D8SB38_SELML|nr:hypothetical protein SELMODRAFT_420143 [Selaginella moellendorffii]
MTKLFSFVIFLLAMALTCSAAQQGLFRFLLDYNLLSVAQVRELMVEVLNRVRNHRNNLAIVGEPITWVATLAEDVRVWVQVRVMDEFWHEDRDGICSTPSNRLTYPFRDLLNSVLEMTESVREQLIDREFCHEKCFILWYNIQNIPPRQNIKWDSNPCPCGPTLLKLILPQDAYG